MLTFKHIALVSCIPLLLFADGPVVNTGQTNVYYLGDDGSHHVGIPRGYERDNVTEVVKDIATELQWQDNAAATTVDLNWTEAVTYCNDLEFANEVDWRLPSVKELKSLVDYGKSAAPTISTIFENISDSDYSNSNYWTSTTYTDMSGGDSVYGVNFYRGDSIGNSKINHVEWAGNIRHFYVRCVRGEPMTESTYARNDNLDVVYDEQTDLTWQDNAVVAMFGEQLAWSAAINYCNVLNFAGVQNWRLPNINELHMIVDRRTRYPAINSAFQNTLGDYWTSTAVEPTDDDTQAWGVTFQWTGGEQVYGGREAHRLNARCVRSGQITSQAEDPYEVEWVRQFGTEEHDKGNAIATSSTNDIYVAGFVFDDYEISTAQNGFISKYTDDGELKWNILLDVIGDSTVKSITVDTNDNIFIGADSFDYNTWENFNFIAKYNVSNGNQLWHKEVPACSRIVSVQTGAQNDLYVSCGEGYPVDNSIVIAKYDNDGEETWNKHVSQNERVFTRSMTLDSDENILVTGSVSVSKDENDNLLHDIFVAKFDKNGNELWYKKFDFASYESIYSIVADQDGNIFIARGKFTYDNEGDLLDKNMFITKFDKNGGLLWHEQFEASSSFRAMTIDQNDNIYLTGVFYHDTDTVWNEVFVAKYNNNGAQLWIKEFGTNKHEEGNAIAIDSNENIYVTGFTTGTFDGESRVGIGDYDVFTAKLSPNITPVANAGNNILIQINMPVTLDGSLSSDADGDTPLTYAWTLVSQPAGSGIGLSDADASSLTFTPEVPGDYNLSLIVTDTRGKVSEPDTVIVTANNTAPIANAGTDQNGVVGDIVELDGSGSSDFDGHTLTYSWSLTRPGESLSVLDDLTSETPSFTPDVVGPYEATLIVHDGYDYSSSDSVIINVVSISTATTETVEETIAAITGMNTDVFSNPNIGNALTNKLNSILDLIAIGEYQQALDKLNSDILPKTDGCTLDPIGIPDKKDWIEDCEEQKVVYDYVKEIIERLESLI